MKSSPQRTVHRETLIYATYYAPRGRNRLYLVAAELSQKYLTPTDLVIGVLGAEGSGKSTLMKGLFPGLELTNDDDGINVRPTPLIDFDPKDAFSGHTFHIDVRYELAFHQKFELTEVIHKAVTHGRRVIIEHFDLVYQALGYNAQVLFGIGEGELELLGLDARDQLLGARVEPRPLDVVPRLREIGGILLFADPRFAAQPVDLRLGLPQLRPLLVQGASQGRRVELDDQVFLADGGPVLNQPDDSQFA